MRRNVIGVVAVVLALAGCAATPAPPAEPQPFAVPTADPTPPVAASPTAIVLTPAEEEIFGPRVVLPDGLLLKQLGKVAQYGGPEDDDSATWGVRVVVDTITVDPNCDQFASEPTRGHWVELTLRVETSKDYDPMLDGGTPTYYEWSTIGPDGVSEAPMGSYSPCHASTELPSEMRASAKYRGTVGVDTANPAGKVVLANFAAWDYPL